MVARTASATRPPRTPDRWAAALALGFVVLLLATEAALVLPDEGDSAAAVATFYAAHRSFVVTLQLLGLAAAAMLGGYAWRLRSVDPAVGLAGLVVAGGALAPTLVTLVLALVADPDRPGPAAAWNALIPRADDLLFVGVVVFAAVVAWRLGRRLPGLGLLAALACLSCLGRLVLEAVGRPRGALEAIGPLSFVTMVAAMAVLSFLGVLRRPATVLAQPEPRAVAA